MLHMRNELTSAAACSSAAQLDCTCEKTIPRCPPKTRALTSVANSAFSSAAHLDLPPVLPSSSRNLQVCTGFQG